MTYVEKEDRKALDIMMKEAGYDVSGKCCCRPSCFDFVARKGNSLVFLRAQEDIGRLSSDESCEIAAISESASGVPLLVSEKSREKKLEDDTVYSRYGLWAISKKTFENIIVRRIYPLIQAGPGGYYVEVDGEAIKHKRQEEGLSIGELAEMLGISRRTLYGYERGMAKASVSAAFNLICILGIPLVKPINVFRKTEIQDRTLILTAKRAIVKSKLLRKIFRMLAHCRVLAVKRAPFDFLINVEGRGMKIVGGVVADKETRLDRRIKEILSVSRVIQAHPILITQDEKLQRGDILCISNKELLRMREPEDLIASFQ